MQQSKLCDQVAVATSDQPQDDPLTDWCDMHQVPVFRGSEHDVLSRCWSCARQCQATHVVRITGDCPLLDWRIADDVARLCLADDRVDYSTNCEPATFPEGMSAEALPMDNLELAHHEATKPFDREHVTAYVRFQPERFHHAPLISQPDLSQYRVTVDYEEDVVALNTLMAHLDSRCELDDVTLESVVNAIRQRADISQMLSLYQRDLWRSQVPQKDQRHAA